MMTSTVLNVKKNFYEERRTMDTRKITIELAAPELMDELIKELVEALKKSVPEAVGANVAVDVKEEPAGPSLVTMMPSDPSPFLDPSIPSIPSLPALGHQPWCVIKTTNVVSPMEDTDTERMF